MTSVEKNLKFIIFVGLIVLLYVPFIVADGMFFPYVTGKAYIFRITTGIIFGIYLILAILHPIYRPKKNFILYTFTAFLISIFISNWTGINPLASFWSNFERMEGWVTIAHLFALFVALGSILREKKDWLILFNASIIASLFMLFSAIGQVIEEGFNTRVATTLGNSTFLGVYMLFNAFLSLFFLLRNKISFRGWYSWVYGIIFVLQSAVVFQTGTRGSMLGLLGGVVLIAVLIALFNKENKIFRKTAFSLIGIVIIFVSSVFLLKETDLVQNNVALKRMTTISITEKTAEARINNWQMAIEGFKERPILGWGQSNFNYVFDKYYLPKHYGNETWFDRVHNILFDWLIAGGLVGLLLYLSIWVSSLFNIWKSIKLRLNEKAVLVGMLGGYFVHNFFVFDQVVSYIYFGFILAFIYSQSRDIDSKDSEFKLISYDFSKKIKKVLVVIILLLIPVLIYSINYPSYATNKELDSALKTTKNNPDGTISYNHEDGIYGNIEFFKKAIERNNFGKFESTERAIISAYQILSIQNLDQDIKQDYVNFVAEKMSEQIKNYPNNSRYPYIFGSFLAQTNQSELAEKYLLQAIRISSTKQELRIPLIRFYNRTGQNEKAVNLAKETFELDESKKRPWKEYLKAAARFDRDLTTFLINEQIEKNNSEWVEEFLITNISNKPDVLQSRISLAAFYVQIDDKKRAAEVLNEAIVDFPDSKREIENIKNLQNI